VKQSVSDFLNEFYSTIVMSSIDRSEHGKKPCFNFRLSEHELKAATHRERMTASLVKDVVDYFKSSNAEITYVELNKAFFIKIDLIKAVLNVEQAQYLSANWGTK
jgi:hypothetical protein